MTAREGEREKAYWNGARKQMEQKSDAIKCAFLEAKYSNECLSF